MSSDAIPQLTVDQAWEMLANDPKAVVIDVRTVAEWNFVGLPDLRSIGNEMRTVEWSTFPTGASNPTFVEDASANLRSDQNILLLCRSGQRSQASAKALKANGFENVHNVAPGFEGDLDADGHRHGGWKDARPWVQS